jgi:glycosyltransferase involved in cell wall biosynthesis
VVSKTGGLAEVVEHQTTGLHIYPNDSHSTAWGIIQMLKKPYQAAQYAQAARYSVTENFNWQNIARQTKALYQRQITQS